MLQRFIIFLIRKRLRVKKEQLFVFSNQKKSSVYWFTDTNLMKIENGITMPANVSLNWMIDSDCAVIPY